MSNRLHRTALRERYAWLAAHFIHFEEIKRSQHKCCFVSIIFFLSICLSLLQVHPLSSLTLPLFRLFHHPILLFSCISSVLFFHQLLSKPLFMSAFVHPSSAPLLSGCSIFVFPISISDKIRAHRIRADYSASVITRGSRASSSVIVMTDTREECVRNVRHDHLSTLAGCHRITHSVYSFSKFADIGSLQQQFPASRKA